MYQVKIKVGEAETEFAVDDKNRKHVRSLAILADQHKDNFSVAVTKIAKPKSVKFKGVGDAPVLPETPVNNKPKK